MMDINGSQYHDFSSLAALRKNASESPDQAVEPVAKQFEALFVQMMLKSMREAVPEGGLFDSDSMKFYQQMMDSQLSVSLAEQGGLGLADTIVQQLSQQTPQGDDAAAEATRLQLRLQSDTIGMTEDAKVNGSAADNSGAEYSVADSHNQSQ
ncbi:rod-binding protein [Spongiibacter nanhainus]|uniref:Rod-binding protein n=1 Tax=Spongiibacter nanhainus TaxID=2794344 RepID=A0A7T4R3C2_9GAMM|nr:rod-binding protein [Spongiibacter nanhainus]QQD19719.1 rod-binding protein [Spongiibacter nanhainus]